tara:strand:+ start:190 stop:354 length:165 start_codon:yes stop_codon:yes gene_type:complete
MTRIGKENKKCLETFLVSVDFLMLNIMHRVAHAFSVKLTDTEESAHGQITNNIF